MSIPLKSCSTKHPSLTSLKRRTQTPCLGGKKAWNRSKSHFGGGLLLFGYKVSRRSTAELSSTIVFLAIPSGILNYITLEKLGVINTIIELQTNITNTTPPNWLEQ